MLPQKSAPSAKTTSTGTQLATYTIFTMKSTITLSLLWIFCQGCAGFSPSFPGRLTCSQKSAVHMNPSQTAVQQQHVPLKVNPSISRRDITKTIASSLLFATLGLTLTPPSSNAEAPPTIWKTGKAPEVPGQKPKDKSDTKGTKKDPSFLRSVADCKTKCENGYGPDGLARSSTECLSACQDICCATYEQCTFAIVPR
jgi:hypothetical protein